MSKRQGWLHMYSKSCCNTISLWTIIYATLGMRHLSLIPVSHTLLENTLISTKKWNIIPQWSSSAVQKILDDLLSKCDNPPSPPKKNQKQKKIPTQTHQPTNQQKQHKNRNLTSVAQCNWEQEKNQFLLQWLLLYLMFSSWTRRYTVALKKGPECRVFCLLREYLTA